jgi:hypothetical protein
MTQRCQSRRLAGYPVASLSAPPRPGAAGTPPGVEHADDALAGSAGSAAPTPERSAAEPPRYSAESSSAVRGRSPSTRRPHAGRGRRSIAGSRRAGPRRAPGLDCGARGSHTQLATGSTPQAGRGGRWGLPRHTRRLPRCFLRAILPLRQPFRVRARSRATMMRTSVRLSVEKRGLTAREPRFQTAAHR